uniref:Epidermal growth factor-like domain-containing protein n=1 Tax=Palpitomonas bilix TaxID=652834 RepID=A0A7S3G8V4_9EUKA
MEGWIALALSLCFALLCVFTVDADMACPALTGTNFTLEEIFLGADGVTGELDAEMQVYDDVLLGETDFRACGPSLACASGTDVTVCESVLNTTSGSQSTAVFAKASPAPQIYNIQLEKSITEYTNNGPPVTKNIPFNSVSLVYTNAACSGPTPQYTTTIIFDCPNTYQVSINETMRRVYRGDDMFAFCKGDFRSAQACSKCFVFYNPHVCPHITCPMGDNQLECSGHGTCNQLAGGCQCEGVYTGATCSFLPSCQPGQTENCEPNNGSNGSGNGEGQGNDSDDWVPAAVIGGVVGLIGVGVGIGFLIWRVILPKFYVIEKLPNGKTRRVRRVFHFDGDSETEMDSHPSISTNQVSP